MLKSIRDFNDATYHFKTRSDYGGGGATIGYIKKHGLARFAVGKPPKDFITPRGNVALRTGSIHPKRSGDIKP